MVWYVDDALGLSKCLKVNPIPVNRTLFIGNKKIYDYILGNFFIECHFI